MVVEVARASRGHGNIRLTSNAYTHVFDEQKCRAAAMINRRFGDEHEGAQPLDGLDAEGARLAEAHWALAGLVDLLAAGQRARQQAHADGDAVGVEAVTDQMVAIMPVEDLVDDLLDALAAEEAGQDRPG